MAKAKVYRSDTGFIPHTLAEQFGHRVRHQATVLVTATSQDKAAQLGGAASVGHSTKTDWKPNPTGNSLDALRAGGLPLDEPGHVYVHPHFPTGGEPVLRYDGKHAGEQVWVVVGHFVKHGSHPGGPHLGTGIVFQPIVTPEA